jgi:RNA recognition motif-containing protein
MSKKLFIGNLPFQATESDVHNTFAQYGSVESVHLIINRETGRSKGFGFIVMDEEAAHKAIVEVSGSEVDGRTIIVNEAKPMVPRNYGHDRFPSHGRR